MRILSCIFFIVGSLISVSCIAQSGQIQGIVLDAKSGIPLASANVFLSSATKNTRTSVEGLFSLKNIPPGQYELVVTYVGYTTFVKKILVTQDVINVKIELEAASIALNDIKIDGSSNRGAYLKMFKDAFIGTSKLAEECVIVNPELLVFYPDKDSNSLETYSKGFLKIENNGLGYRLNILLTNLTVNYNIKLVVYRAKFYFEELEGSAQMIKKWKAKRQETYNGSYRHFYRSLLQNSIRKNGFEIYPVLHDTTISGKIQKFKNLGKQGLDSLEYWNNRQNQDQKVEILKKPLAEKDVIRPSSTTGLYELIFDKYLYMVSKLKKTVYGYNTATMFAKNSDTVLLDQNGILANPLDISYQGMSVEKIAEILPFDYFPDNEPSSTMPIILKAPSAYIDTAKKIATKTRLSDTLRLREIEVYAKKGTRTILDTVFINSATQSKYLIDYVLDNIPGAERHPVQAGKLAFYGLSVGALSREELTDETRSRMERFKNMSLDQMRARALAYGPILPGIRTSPVLKSSDGSPPDYYYLTMDKIKSLRLVHRYVTGRGDVFELQVAMK